MTDRRRRQKEQRAAKRQAEKKQRARRELGRRLLTAFGFGLVVAAVFAAGALFDDEGELPRGYEGFREQPIACGADPPPAEEVQVYDEPEPQEDVTPESEVTATIRTSCGDIVLRLDAAGYPETVQSFVFLARDGFYDGQVFYRILDGFLVETGDPAADGTGGPGYTVPDEFPPEDFTYQPGMVAMSNVGRGTTGSRFFIILDEAAASVLNPRFNLLGEMVQGEETLDRMLEIETARRPGSREQSLPLETVYIEQVVIEVAGS